MARGAADLFAARVAVATTGVLGDEPEEGLPPGTLMIGTMVDGDIQVLTCHLGGRDPEERRVYLGENFNFGLEASPLKQ